MSSPLHESEIIEQCERDLGEKVGTLLEALEAFYGHGFADEFSGDVDSPEGFFYRVHRWIVDVDTQGWKSITGHDSEDQAKADFAVRDAAYSDWSVSS
jgi:hypothetical protein